MERPSLNKILGKLEQQEMSKWEGYDAGVNVAFPSHNLCSSDDAYSIILDSFKFVLFNPLSPKSDTGQVMVKSNSVSDFNEFYECKKKSQEFKKLKNLCGKIYNYVLNEEFNKRTKRREVQLSLLNKTLE